MGCFVIYSAIRDYTKGNALPEARCGPKNLSCYHNSRFVLLMIDDIAVFSALKRFIQLDAPFPISFICFHGLFHLLLRIN